MAGDVFVAPAFFVAKLPYILDSDSFILILHYKTLHRIHFRFRIQNL